MSATDVIYLDHAATTSAAPEVVEAMAGCLADPLRFANPSSAHIAGRAAAAVDVEARQQLAQLLNAAPERFIWTSGATEANNLAIKGAARFRAHRGRHLISMRTEHKAVVDVMQALQKEGFEVTWLQPQEDGVLPVERLAEAIREDTQLVSVMHINNETGVVQDIAAIGELCRERGVLYHCDAAQSVGKLPLALSDLPIDLLSLTAHKFHGPAGIGALYLADRDGVGIEPLLHGGGQQRRLRPGTLPTHLLAGMGAAARLARDCQARDLVHLEELYEILLKGLAGLPGLHVNGNAQHHFPGILNVSAEGVEGESLLLALEPLCVATGSACNSQSGEPSYVLRALGRSDALAQSAIRFSFGRGTRTVDVENARDIYISAVQRLRNIAPERRIL